MLSSLNRLKLAGDSVAMFAEKRSVLDARNPPIGVTSKAMLPPKKYASEVVTSGGVDAHIDAELSAAQKKASCPRLSSTITIAPLSSLFFRELRAAFQARLPRCSLTTRRALNPSGSVGAMDVRVDFVERNRTPISLDDAAMITPQQPRFGNAA